MQHQTDDVRISEIKELLPPVAVLEKFPATETASSTVFESRQAIHRILTGEDPRLLVVIGPCSIHNPLAALDYAQRLVRLADAYQDRLQIVMRTYFEKPRTTVGWKGLVFDPHLDGSNDIGHGLRLARQLLLDINRLGLATATEFSIPPASSILPTSSAGEPSAPAPPNPRCTVSWPRRCPVLSASRTAQTAISGSPSMPFRPVKPPICSQRRAARAALW